MLRVADIIIEEERAYQEVVCLELFLFCSACACAVCVCGDITGGGGRGTDQTELRKRRREDERNCFLSSTLQGGEDAQNLGKGGSGVTG